AFLEKSTGSEGFHQIIDFLSRSHISYAHTRKPKVYISFINQFWRTAAGTDGKVQITATIDGQLKAITEASLRRHLKLEDHDVTKLSDKIGVLENDLKKTKQTYSSAFTKIILRIKKLETKVKTGKARRKTRIVLSKYEDIVDDSSKQGRKISDIDEDPNVFLAQDEGIVLFEDEDVQDKASNETEPVIQEVTPTEVIHDQGSSEKGQSEVSTAGATQGTASEVPIVSTAEVNISTASEIKSTSGRIVYSRRSYEETRKDKGKAIMTEPEPKKKSKKEIEQERLSLAEAIRLQEQINEEQRAQIARDKEIEKYSKKSAEKIEKEDVDAKKEKEEVKPEQVVKEVSKKPGGKRRKILARKRTKDAQDKEISKRQKLDEEEEDDQEEENITQYIEIVPVEEIAINAIPLATKPPVIVMFEPDMESEVWKMIENYDVTAWILYSSCGVHLIKFEGLHIFLLVDKSYPLTYATITKMLDRKLQDDHQNEMAYQLLKHLGSTSGIRACALRNFDLRDMELESNTHNNALAKLPMLKLENGNSWVPVPVTTTPENGTPSTKMTIPAIAEEKTYKKNDVKARSLLLMSLPNEHQLTFDQYEDAQSMLQKLVSRLAILGVVTPLEDLNLKFLRSVPV
ncbi:hypothetical protein Tco_1170690, partial [Tanacetum coccineum]